MKKLILSAIMSVALLGSVSLSAQDATPKKDCCKAKTECKKDAEKKDDKKKCDKKTEDKKGSCCSKEAKDKK